jgi:hypothetical protein
MVEISSRKLESPTRGKFGKKFLVGRRPKDVVAALTDPKGRKGYDTHVGQRADGDGF